MSKKPKVYDAAANSAGSYADGIDAIRLEGVKAGRFFYAAKADKAEREFGLEARALTDLSEVTGRKSGSAGSKNPRAGMTGGPRANIHPTVKPVDLMRWLCRLVTPPGGTVLDPFMGSGTTGIAAVREGFGFVGCEQSPEYFDIACRRIEAAVDYAAREPDLVREITKAVGRKKAEQGELL